SLIIHHCASIPCLILDIRLPLFPTSLCYKNELRQFVLHKMVFKNHFPRKPERPPPLSTSLPRLTFSFQFFSFSAQARFAAVPKTFQLKT
ncbi:MAG: hypothetical protein NTV22_02910, partial [bacterium]|nr:hypothetical protein [bacterium]